MGVTSADITPKNKKNILGTSHNMAAKGFDPPPVFTSSSNFGFSFLLLLPVFFCRKRGSGGGGGGIADGRTDQDNSFSPPSPFFFSRPSSVSEEVSRGGVEEAEGGLFNFFD